MSRNIETMTNNNRDIFIEPRKVDLEETLGSAAKREVTTVIAEGKSSLPTAGAVAEYVSEHSSGGAATLLWEGEFQGSGNIDAEGLSDYLLIGIESKSGLLYLGNSFHGGSDIGQYQGTNLNMMAYRFGLSNDHPDRIIVDSNNRGLTYNSSTTYGNNTADVIIAKIYGLVKKPTTN